MSQNVPKQYCFFSFILQWLYPIRLNYISYAPYRSFNLISSKFEPLWCHFDPRYIIKVLRLTRGVADSTHILFSSNANILVLLSQMDSTNIVKRLNCTHVTTKIILSAARRSQIIVIAIELSHFDFPRPFARACQLKTEHVTGLGGIHIHCNKAIKMQ